MSHLALKHILNITRLLLHGPTVSAFTVPFSRGIMLKSALQSRQGFPLRSGPGEKPSVPTLCSCRSIVCVDGLTMSLEMMPRPALQSKQEYSLGSGSLCTECPCPPSCFALGCLLCAECTFISLRTKFHRSSLPCWVTAEEGAPFSRPLLQ